MASKNKFFSNRIMQCIESCVYILAIIIVIIANTYGSIYIKMLPILFLLGIFGRIFFGRPVVTTVFGITISLCIIYARSNISLIEIVVVSFGNGLNIALGEFLGDYVKILYKRIENKKNVSKKKLKNACISSFVIIIISLFINDFTNGNFFVYNKCKKRLYAYLNDTYGNVQNFEIVNAKYNFLNNKCYVIRIRNSDYNEINKFVIYLEDISIVQDGYKETVLAKNNIKVYNRFKEFCSENKIDSGSLYVNFKYTDVDRIELYLEEDITDSVDNNVLDFGRRVDDFLKSIRKFSYYDKVKSVNITLNNINDITDVITATFDLDGYEDCIKKDKSYEYIMNSLTIEFLGVEI